jgi:hypothetical protein
MKKFLSYAILFLGMPAVLGAVWTAFVVTMDYRSYMGALPAPSGATVAVCGDSQTKDALDPSIVPGLFNFSTAATTCDQDILRLQDLLVANRGKFKYVLLDVSPLKVGYSTERPVSELNAARVHALLHFYHLPVNRRDFGSVGALWRDVICTRKYNEFRKSILRGRPWRSSMAGAFAPDKEKGFLNPKYKAKALEDAKEKADRVNRRPPATPSFPIFGILAESVGLVRASGAIPVLTTMPLSAALRREMDPVRLAAFRAATQTVARRLDVTWLDYLGTDLSDELWHDCNHLNRDGAKAFSTIFAKDFAEVTSRHEAGATHRGVPSVEDVGEFFRVDMPTALGGLSWAGEDTYWSVCDRGGELLELFLPVNRADGMLMDKATEPKVLRRFKVPGAKDLEGAAWDPLRGSVWVSDEKGPRIVEYIPGKGLGMEVNLPQEFRGVQRNRGLEALEISPDGLDMWTCNENELPVDDDASVGPSEFLRLTRFSRSTADGEWRVSGQWAYRPETPGGLKVRGRARNGVSSLCVMPGGELLVLEREKKGEGENTYITRVYLADLTCATDVRGRRSLGEADFAPVGKRLLYTDDIGRAMYEGMSRGPVLDDGSYLLLLVSDGAIVHDGYSGGMLMTLRFRR